MNTILINTSRTQISLGTLDMLGEWIARSRMRRELLDLDDEQLTDVGLSRDTVMTAANKPFWEA